MVSSAITKKVLIRSMPSPLSQCKVATRGVPRLFIPRRRRNLLCVSAALACLGFSSVPSVVHTLSTTATLQGTRRLASLHAQALQSDSTGNDVVDEDSREDADSGASQVKNLQLLEALESTLDYEGRIAPTPGLSKKLEDYRCGFISIVGAPNMGKSTLMNALLDEPLCAATPRPQTTRHAILGVLTSDDCQLCFTDTPGIIDVPAYKLQEGMMEAVRGALRDADVLLVVTDLFSTPIPDDSLFAGLRKTNKPVIVAVNKIDLADKISPHAVFGENSEEDVPKTVTVPEAVSRWRALLPNAFAIIPLCASEGKNDVGVVAMRSILTGGPDVPAAIRAMGRPVAGMFADGVKTVTDEMSMSIIPIGPAMYNEDTLTDRSERFFASEIIRASLFRKLGREIPYCCEVRVTEFKESHRNDPDPIIRMKATIFVERDSQKGIVVGKGGRKVKEVGIDARGSLEDFFQTKIHLDLTVKVDKDWRKNERKLKVFGYVK